MWCKSLEVLNPYEALKEATMPDLRPCPFCGGEIEERGGQCNYGKKIMTLDLMCRKCGTLFKFKSKWIENPYREAVESWNRRAGERKEGAD